MWTRTQILHISEDFNSVLRSRTFYFSLYFFDREEEMAGFETVHAKDIVRLSFVGWVSCISKKSNQGPSLSFCTSGNG